MPPTGSKYCFVTVGATVGFRALVDEVLSDAFVTRLAALGFTHLVVQCGPDYAYFQEKRPSLSYSSLLDVDGFEYTDCIGDYMTLCTDGRDEKGEQRLQGLIICHAGTGSILDALNYRTNVIAVPNPDLMDNHQEELAEQMETEGHLVHGKLGHLDEALGKIADHVPAQWPPRHEQATSAYPGGLYDAISDLMSSPSTS